MNGREVVNLANIFPLIGAVPKTSAYVGRNNLHVKRQLFQKAYEETYFLNYFSCVVSLDFFGSHIGNENRY